MNQTATRAGKKFERDTMAYLRERGLDVERLRLAGVEDEGDVLLRFYPGYEHDKPATNVGPDRMARVVLECKREKGFNIGGWIAEAEAERENYAKHRHLRLEEVGFVVVHARRQHGIGKAYVTTTLDEWLRGHGL